MILEGKTAIVTGASRGIGRAIALELASLGAHSVMAARDAAALSSAVREIRAIANGSRKACYLAADLRDPDAPLRLAEFAIAQTRRIDIVVNNAGATKRGNFLDLNDDDWADGFALKFFGAVRLTRACWTHLAAARGSLVNISGTGGRTPGAAFSIGGSVNAAMQSFSKAMAEQGIADGVQVNVINPGAVRTDRLDKRLRDLAEKLGVPGDMRAAEREFVKAERVTRVGEPADVAALVAFLVSPRGRFLHGAMIDMDGGSTKTL